MADLKLNLKQIPFSTYGSALTITKLENQSFGFDREKPVDDGYYMRAMYEDDRYRMLFRLSFDGDFAGMWEEYEPQLLTLHKGENEMKICVPEDNVLRFCGRAESFELYMSPKELIKYNAALFIDDHHIGLNVYTRKSMVYTIKGTLSLEAPWGDNETSQIIRITVHPDESGEIDFVYEDFRSAFSGMHRTTTFAEDAAKKQAQFREFLDKVPQSPLPEYQETMEKAYYILWNNVLRDNQLIRRPTILASKNWMCCAWHMANMFHLRALMATHPDLAWEQYLAFVDQQDENGCMPDWIASYKINDAFTKPPVEGVMFLDLMRHMELEKEKLSVIHDSLSRLVSFWMNYRDYDGDGIPEYCHGNDSCADNCTVFDVAPNVEAPDLATYLALDMECLAVICEKLGDVQAAKAWMEKSKELIERMIAHSYDEQKKQFVSKISGSHQLASGDSMINFLPVLLGKRLPEEIQKNLIEGLCRENRFFTPYGIASESLTSEKYLDDSYWRGPVWAPWTLFAVMGLKSLGECDLADQLAAGYMDTICREGFYENHNARTGAGQRDSAYDWTADTFLILLQEKRNEEA